MPCVISGQIVTESNPNQPYIPGLIDGGDDFLEMTFEVPRRVRRKRGVIDRRAVRHNDEDFSSFVTTSQAACSPSDGFTVHVLFGQFFSYQVANRRRRSGILIIGRPIDDVQKITEAARVGGAARV